MVTKKDYEDAIKKIREAFYSSICDEWALEQIAVNLDFLSSLINEHFEEKVETNFEHYYEDFLKIGSGSFGVTDGKVKQCYYMSCSQCDIKRINNSEHCRINAIKWLASPYKKPTYKLTKFEYDLLNAHKDSGMQKCLSNYIPLLELNEKGYFKYIDTNIPIHEILDNCEVIK